MEIKDSPIPVLPAPGGEEFRDDTRVLPQRTAGAARKLLPPETLFELTRLDPLRSTWAIAQTIGLLALVIGMAVTHWAWWTALLAVLLIAPLQHALFVLAHDAAHYRLYETRWLNDAVGRIVGTIAGVSMCTYRVIHRLHHNHLYGAQDPDVALHGGYPRGTWYLVRKLVKDVTGQTAWKTYAYFFGAPALNVSTNVAQRPLDDTSASLRRAARRDRWGVLAFHIGAPIAAFLLGYGWQYLVLWVLPLITVLQAILRLRAICEHGAVIDLSGPLTAARTNLPGLFLRFVLFPHHVNYHVEHHLYPAVPHYRLPALHCALAGCGALAGAEVRRVGDTFGMIFAERASDAAPQRV
jgi:fatty acid desaturase